MQKVVRFEDQEIPYELRRSHRARAVRIMVSESEKVTVTVPHRLPERMAEIMVAKRAGWLLKTLAKFRAMPRFAETVDAYREKKAEAEVLARAKVAEWNAHYNFPVQTVNIRDQKSRWGSCSKRGTINLNYRIVYLPEKLLDYLVVHELCHLGAMNHSPRFWNLVAETIPTWKEDRRILRNYARFGN